MSLVNTFHKLDIQIKVCDIEKYLQKFQTNFFRARSA